MREDRVKITQAIRPPQTTRARADNADALFLPVLDEIIAPSDPCCVACVDACFEAMFPKLQPMAAIKIQTDPATGI